MTQIFISYKSQYQEFAERLRDQMRTWGFNTWLDKDNIPEGTYFRHEIQKGLENSQIVVGVLTPEALESREVMWEWDYGLYNSRLIPIKYQDCSLPYHLAGTQYIDFTRDEAGAFAHLRQVLTTPHDTLVVPQRAGPVHSKPETVQQTKPEDTNRSRMLQKVHDFWVVGVLENALKESGAFELALDVAPGAVLKHVNYGDYSLPTNAKIIDVFDDMNRELLILGTPGAGKTVLLLQLARDLITRAQADAKQPIPVVFNLSSWTLARKNLDEWLIDELRLRYQIPKKVATEWVEREQLLLLLDGLDEVSTDYRNACVEAINEFRKQYRSVDLAVCSRIADYDMLTSKLDLQGAITLQPLTTEQIDSYLVREDLAGLREVTHTDAALQAMAGTPFLLNTMAVAYKGVSAAVLKTVASDDSGHAWRTHLFDAYVEKRLASSTDQYTPRQTRHYLAWLAEKMVEHGQTVFYIEGLHPGWLNLRRRSLKYKLAIWFSLVLIFGLASGLFFAITLEVEHFLVVVLNLLFLGSRYELNVLHGVLIALLLGLVLGLVPGLVIGLRPAITFVLGRPIRPTESLGWSWSRFRWGGLIVGILSAVLLGAASVIIAFLFDPAMNSYYCFRFGTPYCEDTITLEQIIQIVTDWQNATIRNLSMAVIIGGIGGYFAGGIVSGFTGRVVEMRTAPNQGIRRSARNAIRIGYAAITILILVWLPILLTAGGFRLLENRLLGWPILGIFAAFLAPLIGFLLALSAGGNAVIKHGFLRFILRRRGDIPTNYARFLDYAGSIGILRKVGGGYIFVHRYLLEYFAELKS